MKTFILLTIVQLTSLFSYGFIMPIETVIKKNTALSGNQIFSVEQDVIFKDASREFVIHESWLIEGDKNLKVVATGLGELKDTFRFVAIYNTKNRSLLYGKNRATEITGRDFFERYLSIRSYDSYKNYLTALTISPAIRLSRVNGAPAFAIGEPSPIGKLKPQIWIDQETFSMRKIRLPSEAEVSFSDYATYGQIQYPKVKKVSWAGKEVLIKVKSLGTKTGATLSSFYPQKLDQPTDMQIASKGPVALVIEEFYKRFR
jgi:hypothetical protein